MSNLSTLPKGDSAWLLRKAIERIMQQISVLETNIGSSTTGNSNDTEIIFNDAGTLRGDKDFAWNKTSNILTVDGSATITGDLTVDTSTLKVDSANNRVGVNIATPLNNFHVNGEVTLPINNLQYWNAYYSAGFKSVAAGYAGYNGFATNGDFLLASTDTSAAGPTSALTFYNRYRISNAGIHTWENVGGVAGTAMTLNANGLGVGTSPSYNIDVLAATLPTISVRSTLAGASNARLYLECAGTNSGHITYNRSLQALQLGANGGTTAQVTLDASGNVGIGGVTPVNKLTIGTGTFNASTVSGSASLYATVSSGLVVLADGLAVATRGGVNRLIANSAGDIISSVTGTAPSLTDNGFMVFNLTSNTNLRISVRGTDGTTRTANITLA